VLAWFTLVIFVPTDLILAFIVVIFEILFVILYLLLIVLVLDLGNLRFFLFITSHGFTLQRRRLVFPVFVVEVFPFLLVFLFHE